MWVLSKVWGTWHHTVQFHLRHQPNNTSNLEKLVFGGHGQINRTAKVQSAKSLDIRVFHVLYLFVLYFLSWHLNLPFSGIPRLEKWFSWNYLFLSWHFLGSISNSFKSGNLAPCHSRELLAGTLTFWNLPCPQELHLIMLRVFTTFSPWFPPISFLQLGILSRCPTSVHWWVVRNLEDSFDICCASHARRRPSACLKGRKPLSKKKVSFLTFQAFQIPFFWQDL